jgi:hypothetical protein
VECKFKEKKKTMKKEEYIKVGLLWVIGFVMMFVLLKEKPYQQTYSDTIRQLEKQSVSNPIPKYKVKQQFQITHSDGTPVKVFIVKFECCLTRAFVNRSNEMYLGYYNEVKGKPISATTTQMIPEIEMSMFIHEIFHIVSLHHLSKGEDPITHENQEKMAYDIQSLYEQLVSLEGDGYIKLTK